MSSWSRLQSLAYAMADMSSVRPRMKPTSIGLTDTMLRRESSRSYLVGWLVGS